MVDLTWRGFLIGWLLSQRTRSKHRDKKAATESRYEDLIVDSFRIHHYRHMSKPLVPVSKTRFNRKLYSRLIHPSTPSSKHSTAQHSKPPFLKPSTEKEEEKELHPSSHLLRASKVHHTQQVPFAPTLQNQACPALQAYTLQKRYNAPSY